MKRAWLLVVVLLVAFVNGAFADSWADSLRAERAEADEYLANSPLSPFAAIGQTVLRPGQALRVVLPVDTLLLGYPTADPGLPQLELTYQPDVPVVYVRSPHGGDFHLNRQKIGPIPLAVSSADTVHAEIFLLKAYASNSSARLRAFKPGGYGQTQFHGLNWYPPNPDLRLTATITPAARDTVIMPTSAGLEKSYIRHSTLRFTVDGFDQTLTLFAPASDPDAYGFIPFTDAGAGEATYGGGRYIDLDLPADGQTELTLDFNDAYNPLCAYVPHYNCPIPPPENALDIAIEAGEMIYEKH